MKNTATITTETYGVRLIFPVVEIMAVVENVLVCGVEAGFDAVLHHLTGSRWGLKFLNLDHTSRWSLVANKFSLKNVHRRMWRSEVVPSSWRRWYWWGGPLLIWGPAASQGCWLESCSAKQDEFIVSLYSGHVATQHIPHCRLHQSVTAWECFLQQELMGAIEGRLLLCTWTGQSSESCGAGPGVWQTSLSVGDEKMQVSGALRIDHGGWQHGFRRGRWCLQCQWKPPGTTGSFSSVALSVESNNPPPACCHCLVLIRHWWTLIGQLGPTWTEGLYCVHLWMAEGCAWKKSYL